MSSQYILDECSKLMVEEYTGWKPPKTTTVRMDGRHKHIQMLLEWDKVPRGPLPPPLCPILALCLKVKREDYERVLAQYKRVGYAYAEVEDVDAEKYDDVDEQDPEYEEARLRKEELKELGPVMESLVKDCVTDLSRSVQISESRQSTMSKEKEKEKVAKSVKAAKSGSRKRKKASRDKARR